MFKNYVYEKPAFIGKKSTDALTAAFAGGGWLHIDSNEKKHLKIQKLKLSFLVRIMEPLN